MRIITFFIFEIKIYILRKKSEAVFLLTVTKSKISSLSIKSRCHLLIFLQFSLREEFKRY